MGLFEEIEKRKNVYSYNSGPLTEDEKKTFMKRMTELNKCGAPNTVFSTNTIAQRLSEIALEEKEAKVVEQLLEILLNLYLQKTITAKRYAELEQLLLSTDSESKVLAVQIIKSLYKKEIVIEDTL